MTPRILITGAGPTGLALAILLRQAGLSADLIERKRARDRVSKALSINPSAMAVLDRAGALDSVLDEAFLNHDFDVRCGRKLLRTISLRGLPGRDHFAMVPQWRTEVALRTRLAELGGSIQAGTRLVGLEERGDGVRVQLADPSGRQRTEVVDWVVGCDGGRSSVRQLAGIAFPGKDYPMHFAMTDAMVRWGGLEDQWHYSVSDHGFFILIPMRDGLHRVVLSRPGNQVDVAGYRQCDFQALVAETGFPGVEIRDRIWTSAAPFYSRLAETFTRGRVVLAGDAAHLFSPIGGQGMNTGLADAAALADALGAWATGQAEAVGRYALERRRHAEFTRAWTGRLTDLISGADRRRDAWLEAFTGDDPAGLARVGLPHLLAGADSQYRSPPGLGLWHNPGRLRC